MYKKDSFTINLNECIKWSKIKKFYNGLSKLNDFVNLVLFPVSLYEVVNVDLSIPQRKLKIKRMPNLLKKINLLYFCLRKASILKTFLKQKFNKLIFSRDSSFF